MLPQKVQVLASQIIKGDLSAAGQRMVLPADQIQGIPGQRGDLKAGMVHRLHTDAHGDAALQHHFVAEIVIGVNQRDVLLLQTGQTVLGGKENAGGNSQTQGFSGLSARLNLFQQKLVLPTEGFCMFFQKLPLFRQLDALGPPIEKGNAQFCFQTVDKAADPLLAHV